MEGIIKVQVDAELEEIVPNFLKNRQKDILAIHSALKREDYEAIRILGHSMKGSGASYGFDVISDLGKALEGAAISRDRNTIAETTENLALYLERVEVEFVEE